LPEILLSRKLGPPISRIIFNHGKVARKLPGFNFEPQDCPCRKHFPLKFRPNNGCVRTGDLSIITQAKTREIFSFGAQFKSKKVDFDPLGAIENAFRDFISFQAKKRKKEKEVYEPWLKRLLEICKINLLKRTNNNKDFFLSPKVLRYINFLQHHLVFLPMDKAANNIAIECKFGYCLELRNELNKKDGAYETILTNIPEIIENHKTFLSEFSLWKKANEKLGYLFKIPKFHKSGDRCVAGLQNSTTTELGIKLSDLCTFILSALREKDNLRIKKDGIRRFLKVEGYEEVADFFKKWKFQSKIKKINGSDFENMFTSIPHSDFKEKTKIVISEVWDYIAKKMKIHKDYVCLAWHGKKNCSWERNNPNKPNRHSNNEHQFSCEEFHQMIVWLVDNIFLVNGKICRRQKSGIPMGTNPAPAFCNMYLYYYESTWIDKLVEKGLSHLALQYHLTFRLIDDVFSADNPDFDDFQKNCFPTQLNLKETTLVNGDLNFLGMKIKNMGHSLDFQVYDKKKDFPFEVVRYPHLLSEIPENICYGVFTSMLYRFYRINSSHTSFLEVSIEMANIFLTKECTPGKLFFQFKRFICKQKKIRWSVQVHILSVFSKLNFLINHRNKSLNLAQKHNNTHTQTNSLSPSLSLSLYSSTFYDFLDNFISY
jgi:hypothetical protein